MNLAEEYKKKLVTPEEAVKVVESGDWIEYGSFSGNVVLLVRALAARKDDPGTSKSDRPPGWASRL